MLCVQSRIGGSRYGCLQCTFLVHKSCAELQEEILQHPFHPQHPLTIVALKTYELGLCNACGSKQHTVFVYKCAECDFNLDLQCASLTPTIRYDRPENRHLPMNRHSNQTIGDFQFSTCSSTFMGFFLRCVPCNLNLHVKCFPALPHTAKHRAHRHLLTLSDPLPKRWFKWVFLWCLRERKKSRPLCLLLCQLWICRLYWLCSPWGMPKL